MGRKDGHEVGETNDVCDQQPLAPFAMELHTLGQDLADLKEEMEWELELPQPCHQGKAAD